MKRTIQSTIILCALLLGVNLTMAQSKTYDVKSFDEVIISPHIEVVFEKAETQSVVIENIDVGYDKLNVEVKGKDPAHLPGGRQGLYQVEKNQVG